MSQAGKTAFLKRLRKSVMSRLRPLSQDERLDFTQLVAQGVPEGEARAIAQGYSNVRKSAGTVSDTYLRAFHKAAKAQLPAWQHQVLHRAAHSPAVKQGRSTACDRRDESKSTFIAELDALRERIKVVQAQIGKASPLASEVHVPVPLGSDGKKPNKKALVLKRDLPATSAQELAFIQAAYGLQEPTLNRDMDADDVDAAVAPLLQANRLVQGMDFEMRTTADVEVARQRASRMLKEQPSYYAMVGQRPELRGMHGLMLDICCGNNRLEGHLGLDVFAYDHGVVLHDIALGLPFPEASVAHINMADCLAEVLPHRDRLLMECQRVLMPGGLVTITAQQPLVDSEADFVLPGLVLMDSRQTPGGVVQVLRRAPLRLPAYHGADPTYSPMPGPSSMPVDMQMALAAYNTSSASMAMANLIHKAENAIVPIAKTDDERRIITGVVLSGGLDVDTQGDYMHPEDIELAAHNYLKQSRVVGSEHGRPIDANVVESYIAPQDLNFDGPAGIQHVHKGSWIMSVHVPNDAEWAMVKSGEYSGFSVGGLGTRSEAPL